MMSVAPPVEAAAFVGADARPSSVKVWLLATRPATLLASVVPVLVGTVLAWADGKFAPVAAALALLGAVAIQIGTNLHNDYADFMHGADTHTRLGPPRATQRGWLTPNQVMRGALLAFGFAVACGLGLVAIAGWPVVALGAFSIACGVAYTGGPFPLAYYGLGDIFVFLCFGIAAVCGTYFVQTLEVSLLCVVAASMVGLLSTAILVVNNLRDRNTDAAAGKRTVVVRFGQRFGQLEYAALFIAAFALPVGAYLFGLAGPGWLFALFAAPQAARLVNAVWRTDGAHLNPYLGQTAKLEMRAGLCLCIGIVVDVLVKRGAF